MGIYESISDFLRRSPGNNARLTFAQVERIIGRPLPKSAYRYSAWWSNNPTGHSHARSWTEVGWKTEQVDLEKRALVFAKIARPPTGEGGPASDPFGAMRGSVTFFPGVDLTEPSGEEWAAERAGGE